MAKKKLYGAAAAAHAKKHGKKSTSPAPTKRKRRRSRRVGRARAAAHRATSALADFTDNPAPLTDLAQFVLPGFAGYAGTRLLSRIVYVQLSKRYPSAAKHIAVGSTFATALAAWLLVHRWKKIEKYHTPVVVGSSIAALQTLIQTYLPKFGWMVSDVQPAELAAVKPKAIDDGEDLDDEAVGADDLSDIDMDSVGSLSGATIPDVDDEDDLYE